MRLTWHTKMRPIWLMMPGRYETDLAHGVPLCLLFSLIFSIPTTGYQVSLSPRVF
jgi:hypothetical protein